MKKSNVIMSLFGVMICVSLLNGVTATEYVGIAVDDIFVWELDAGGFMQYIKYNITEITETEEDVNVKAELSVYDVYIDLFEIMPNSPFTFFYPEVMMRNLDSLGTSVSNETKTYGGLVRDCRVVEGVTNYVGDITIDALTGLMLEMATNTTGTLKLVSWEDQNLVAEYKNVSNIAGYRVNLFGIGIIIPIVYILIKYRK
jgi:hypothetical protein